MAKRQAKRQARIPAGGMGWFYRVSGEWGGEYTTSIRIDLFFGDVIDWLSVGGERGPQDDPEFTARCAERARLGYRYFSATTLAQGSAAISLRIAYHQPSNRDRFGLYSFHQAELLTTAINPEGAKLVAKLINEISARGGRYQHSPSDALGALEACGVRPLAQAFEPRACGAAVAFRPVHSGGVPLYAEADAPSSALGPADSWPVHWGAAEREAAVNRGEAAA